ncbi:hypothetical protein Plhal703r1_c38g0135831 [Plasmopara halstedii]
MDYIAISKEDEAAKALADRIQGSLLTRKQNLNVFKGLKLRGEGAEGDVPVVRISSDKEKPHVQELSYKQEELNEPHNDLRPASKEETEVYKLFISDNVDKVTKDLFTSDAFRSWSKHVADAFPDDRKLGADLMVSALAKHRMDKLEDFIPTTEAVDGKLAFANISKKRYSSTSPC